MTDTLLLERERGLLTLRLNRPEKKNALTRAMYSQWPKPWRWLTPTRRSVRC